MTATKTREMDPAPELNGLHPEPPALLAPVRPAPPPIVNRHEWVDLPAVQYPGYRFRMWVNYPSSLLVDIQSGIEERTMAAVKRIVHEHNGWSYQDEASGEICAYPSAQEDAFWSMIPAELAGCVFALVRTVPAKLPNSITVAKGS